MGAFTYAISRRRNNAKFHFPSPFYDSFKLQDKIEKELVTSFGATHGHVNLKNETFSEFLLPV